MLLKLQGQGTPSHNSSGNPPGGSTPNSTVPNSMHSPGNSSSKYSSYLLVKNMKSYCTRKKRNTDFQKAI